MMKNIALIIILFAGITGKAQISIPSKPSYNIAMPVFFIDSVRIKHDDNRFKYIAPDEYKAINVVKKSAQYPDGAIYIKLRDHNLYLKLMNDKLLSLADIEKANYADFEKSKPVIYLLDDKLLTDTAHVNIPSMYVKKVTVIKASETAYFKTALPDAVILMISTKAPEIFIRGASARL